MKMPPWLKTRPIGAVDASRPTVHEEHLVLASHMFRVFAPKRKIGIDVKSSDKYLSSTSATHSVVPGVTLLLDF